MRALIPMFMILLLNAQTAQCQNLATFGQTYPIIEQDFEQALKDKLNVLNQQGKLNELLQNWHKHIKSASLNPTGNSDLPPATKSRKWLFDPSIVVAHDIRAPNGIVIAKQGQRVNPLSIVSLKTPLLLFDGQNDHQIKWLKAKINAFAKQNITIKAIATRANLTQLNNVLDHSVYFDQGGKLIAHFAIQHLPAVIVQKGLMLEISEEPI